MTTKQRLKTSYFVYIFSVFVMPLMLVILYFAQMEKKHQPKAWVKSHYATLKRYTLLNFAWLVVTFLLLWLASLIGFKTYVFFFGVSLLSLIWLWIFNFEQYFSMVIAFTVERELKEPAYFEQMKYLFTYFVRIVKDKFDRRKVKNI